MMLINFWEPSIGKHWWCDSIPFACLVKSEFGAIRVVTNMWYDYNAGCERNVRIGESIAFVGHDERDCRVIYTIDNESGDGYLLGALPQYEYDAWMKVATNLGLEPEYQVIEERDLD